MMKTIYSSTAIALIIVFGACQYATETSDLEPKKFKEKMEQQPDAVTLDVRTPGEFHAGHLPGALNIDFEDESFSTEIGKFDPSKTYLLYCQSGRRTRGAAEIMKQNGFQKIFEMKGGFPDWEKEGYPVEK